MFQSIDFKTSVSSLLQVKIQINAQQCLLDSFVQQIYISFWIQIVLDSPCPLKTWT